MIVVDSSAIVAMMLDEPGAELLTIRLASEPADERVMSAANYVEAGTVLAGRHRTPARAAVELDAFLAAVSIRLSPVDEELARLALAARIRFGKGFGSRSGLNYGDSFAYALAKRLDAPLLFVGDDFGRTDLARAV